MLILFNAELIRCQSNLPISARFENIKLFTPLQIHFQLNLNTNTERVNSPIV